MGWPPTENEGNGAVEAAVKEKVAALVCPFPLCIPTSNPKGRSARLHGDPGKPVKPRPKCRGLFYVRSRSIVPV